MADNASIYRDTIARFNDGDLEGYLALYSDDVVFGGITPEPMDKPAVRAFHQQFVAAFPGAQTEIADLVAEDDKLAVRLVLSLHHAGNFMGVPASDNDAIFVITTILTMRDGKCVERWSTADMYGLMAQIGGIPGALTL